MKIKQKLKQSIFLVVGFLLCTMCTAGAAYIDNADLVLGEDKVILNGRFFDGKNGEDVTILVLEPNADIENLSDSDVEKQEQLRIKDGSFSLEFPLHNPVDGVYTAYIKVGGTEKITTFKRDSQINAHYSEVMGAGDAQSFYEKISQYASELILNESIYSRIEDKQNVALIVYGLKDSIDNAEELKNTIKAVSYVQALNESKLSEIVDNNRFIPEEILGMDTLDEEYVVNAYELYNNSISEAGITKVLANLQGNNYTSVDAFKKDFIYECTIAGIKMNKNSGTAHIKNILNKNNSVNGFDLTNYNSVTGNTIDLLLLNGREWEKADIQRVLNTVVKTPEKEKDTSSEVKAPGQYSQFYPVIENVQTPDNVASVFNDIADVEWAKEAIENLYQKGIINGKAEGVFAPNDNVTRAEFLKMAIMAFGLEDENTECEFTDVKSDAWYYSVVASAYNLGIAKGYDDGSFGANDLITRQDAAVIIFRAAEAAKKTVPDNGGDVAFSDFEQISDYAVDSVNNLVKAKVLQGSDGKFMPKQNCTRAQAAVMINNITELTE